MRSQVQVRCGGRGRALGRRQPVNEGTNNPPRTPASQSLAATLPPAPSVAGRESCQQTGRGLSAQNRVPGLPAWPLSLPEGQTACPPCSGHRGERPRRVGCHCRVSCLGWGLGSKWDHSVPRGRGWPKPLRGKSAPEQSVLGAQSVPCSAPTRSPNPCSEVASSEGSDPPQTLLPTEKLCQVLH